MENAENTATVIQDQNDRQSSLLHALKKLRDEVSRIEEQHPGLNVGLTAICDEALQSLGATSPVCESEKLSVPEVEISAIEVRDIPCRPGDCFAPFAMTTEIHQDQKRLDELQPEEPPASQSIEGFSVPRYSEETAVPSHCEEPTLPCHCEERSDEAISSISSVKPDNSSPSPSKTNPLVSALDGAGNCIVLGLDKAGDGIIFVLESMLGRHKHSNGNK